jgi:hypothetical protein
LSAVACAGGGPPALQDGDIVFQTSMSTQSDALRIATASPYTHMGIVFVEDDGPIVLEAVGPVKLTPLGEWTRRGKDGRFVVKRLADARAVLTADAVARLRDAADRYTGKPYDAHFRWSDERIYCSELVWKVYKEATGVEIGDIQTFREFDLSDPVVSGKIEERFGDSIPMDEPVVTPASMFASKRLVTVYAN